MSNVDEAREIVRHVLFDTPYIPYESLLGIVNKIVGDLIDAELLVVDFVV